MDALGRVLYNDLISTIEPAQDNAAMDGYAFAHKSLGQKRNRKAENPGSISAGEIISYDIFEGECVKIMTGARCLRRATQSFLRSLSLHLMEWPVLHLEL